MKPWTWSRRAKLIVLAPVAGAVAVVMGVVMLVQGAGGAENRVTASALPFSLPCGISVPVRVYLNDLEARPSPNTPGVNYGLNAFAFWIDYDPDVLRIQSPDHILLDPHLNEADHDGDGVFPEFMVFGPYIDNYSGVLTYAAGSVVVDPVTLLGEEGPDPVAEGGSIQLFVILFLANSAGTSPVTISQVQLGDPGQVRYEPVEITNTSVTIYGDDCPDLPRPTPTPTAEVTPTPEPTATPTPTPTPQRLGGPPEPVEPVLASEGGRPDCPAGWYVYKDPDGHFSICYPPDWSARASPPQIRDSGWSVHIKSPIPDAAKTGPSVGSAGLTVGWRAGSPIVVGCAGAPIEGGREETVEVAGHEAVACHFEMPEDVPAPELATSSKSDRVEMDIPLDGGGYLWVVQMRTVESIDLSRLTLEAPLVTLRVGMGQEARP